MREFCRSGRGDFICAERTDYGNDGLLRFILRPVLAVFVDSGRCPHCPAQL
ncbi:MAG: hypothetical protein LBV07_06615 [Syntrophobacterales bacterium]|nr:hypothetical protein [Syntrophobacterales bacterium]